MDTLLRKFNLNVDTRERDIERAGFVGAQQQALDVNQEHALMEIRFQHMSVRTEWLNNLNTQAAFIAGISIAWLGGDVLAEVSDEVVFANSDGTPVFLDKLLKLTYLLFATLSGGAGLWVVIYSNRCRRKRKRFPRRAALRHIIRTTPRHAAPLSAPG